MPMKLPLPQKKEEGQSLVELAIGMILLLIILAGIVDLGRAIFTLMAMQDAAEEGIVYGVAFPTSCSQITSRVTDNLSHKVLPKDISVAVQIDGIACGAATNVTAGQQMLVEVTENFQITMPLLGSVIGQHIPLKATANGVLLRPKP